MSEPERVTLSVSGGMADVRLNRPDKLNALDQPMFWALVEAADRLAHDPSVRVVVLSGEGRAFCAGLDLASFQAMGEGADAVSGSGRSLAGFHPPWHASGDRSRAPLPFVWRSSTLGCAILVTVAIEFPFLPWR